MTELNEFCSNELFRLYFKLASEVESTTADRKAQLTFLQLCLHQSKKLIEHKKQSDPSQIEMDSVNFDGRTVKDYEVDADIVRMKIRSI